MLAAACAVHPAHSAGPAPAAADYGTVGYAEIDDVIDRFQDRYLARIIEQARVEDVDTPAGPHRHRRGGGAPRAHDVQAHPRP